LIRKDNPLLLRGENIWTMNNLGKLASGVYTLQIVTANNKSKNIQIIKKQ